MVDFAEQDSIDTSYKNQGSRVTSACADPLLVGMPMALALSNQPRKTHLVVFGVARPAWPPPTCRSLPFYTLYRFAAQVSPAPNPTVMMYFAGSRSS
jgi:hypothetical protein